MLSILSYPVTVVYYLVFGCILVFFHPIQWVCHRLLGYQAHKKSVDALNGALIANTYILGTRYKINGLENLPENEPLIIVANHQSLLDIIMISWFLRKVHPKFVSKIELGKGIPSVSFNLKYGGSVMIDRKDGKQAIREIKKIGEYVEQNNRAVVIFPEGTRSRDGHPKRFAESGLKVLFKYVPSARVIPVSINNSWRVLKNGSFPLALGEKLTMDIHPPIKFQDHAVDELIPMIENTIVNGIKN